MSEYSPRLMMDVIAYSWPNLRVSKNVPGIPGACATRNFTYLVRGPWVAYNKAKQNQRINAFGMEKF